MVPRVSTWFALVITSISASPTGPPLARLTTCTASPSPLDRTIKAIIAPTTIVYGLKDDLTLLLNTPFVRRKVKVGSTGRTIRDTGVADLTFLTKWRLFRDDFGPNDTRRLDLLAGVEIPSGDSAFSSDSYDPILGGVFTHAQGRHAFDAVSVGGGL